MKVRNLTLPALLCYLALPVAALAHEPLWGESPQTFAFGIWHPEVRFGYENATRLLSGSKTLLNANALQRFRYEAVMGLQYAPKTSLNLKIEVPVVRLTTQDFMNGQRRSSTTRGLGNIALTARSRFDLKVGEDWKRHQAFTVGVTLPTGENRGRLPDGTLLGPSFQPGSRKFGVVLGYSFAYERLKDTTWVSLQYQRDFEGAGRRGDLLQIDASYGYWLRKANRPQETGVVLALGLHQENQGRDRLSTGSDPDSGYSMTGLHLTLITTQGQGQFRIGALIPVTQNINGVQLRPELQIRAGLEILL